MEPACAIITSTDPNPVSSRTKGLTMINKRVMPYCINMLDGNVACMMGAESGGSGFYGAINPQLQVDLLNTTTMTFTAGAARPTHPCDACGLESKMLARTACLSPPNVLQRRCCVPALHAMHTPRTVAARGQSHACEVRLGNSAAAASAAAALMQCGAWQHALGLQLQHGSAAARRPRA